MTSGISCESDNAAATKPVDESSFLSDNQTTGEESVSEGEASSEFPGPPLSTNHNCNMRIPPWKLPRGAEYIIRSIAAQHILHELLDQCCELVQSPSHHTQIDFAAIEAIAQEFPGIFGHEQEFRVDTRDAHNRRRWMLPLAILLCLNPPLSTVRAVYQAYPAAIQAVDSAKGATPLLYACSFEASASVVKFLIEQYPHAIRIPRKDGATALAMACSYKSPPEVLELLIQQWPQGIQHTSIDGWYPIHAAVACEAPVQTIQQLYQAYPEAVRNVHNNSQSTALHLACSKGAAFSVVDFLLRVAPELAFVQDAKRMTPWLWAAYAQSVDVIKLFLETFDEDNHIMINNHEMQGQQLPLRWVDGMTLLHFAARQNSKDVIEFLGAKFPRMLTSKTRSRGLTPLHMAIARRRSLAEIEALVQLSPRTLFIRNQAGKFPIETAKEARVSSDVLDYLQEKQQLYKVWWW